MTKIEALRRLLHCFTPSASSTPPAACRPSITITSATGRISATLRDPLAEVNQEIGTRKEEDSKFDAISVTSPHAPSRPSKTLVVGTIFGPRRGHVWFCIQHSRLSTKPFFLLELSIPTHQLVKEMDSSEMVRIALDCSSSSYSCPLRSVPMWTFFCNGKKLGYAVKRKPNDDNRSILSTLQSVTVGAGIIPPGHSSEEIMYMRANYEHVVRSADFESFHLINPEQCPSQDLSVFLLRSK